MSRNGNGNRAGSIPASVPLDVQRLIRDLQTQVQSLQAQVQQLQTQMQGKLGNDKTDLAAASATIRDNLQANGSSPLSITKLPGVAAQAQPSAAPTNTTLGGVTAYTAPPHQYLNAILNTGMVQSAQPSAADITGLGPGATSNVGNLVESTSSVLNIVGGTGAVIGNGTSIQVKQATASVAGYLAAADWAAFNGKQNALGYTPLNPANNLSDLSNEATARGNLGLGTAATQPSTAFDAAGSAASAQAASLQKSNNLSDLVSASVARGNLGLGTAATQASTAFDSAGSAASAQSAAEAYASNAGNLTSGTLASARLPNPTVSAIGGVQAVVAVAHEWVNAISTSGVPSLTQPSFADISGSIATGQVPTLNQNTTGTAANVTGTVAVGNGGTGATTASAALTALMGSWQSWTPTVSGSGSMTVSGVTVNDAQYIQVGPFVIIKCEVTLTLGGTVSNNLSISLPVVLAGNNSGVCVSVSNPSWSAAFGYISGSSVTVYPNAMTNYSLGSCQILITGVYRSS